MLRACFAPYSNSTQIYSNLSCWDCLSTFREPIVVALYSHWLQSYVILYALAVCDYSDFDCFCFLLSEWSQSNFDPLCINSLCNFRLPFCVALHSHWSQSDLIAACFDCLWTLRFDVDVLGIETGLSADDIEDRGGDNVERTDVVNFSPGRSNFPLNFFRSRKLRNFGSDILSTGKFKSNWKYQKIQVIN